MTPKQRHRTGAFDLHRDSLGLVRCALRDSDGHTCGGRLQAHHAIPVQTLKRLHAQAARGASMVGIRSEWEQRLANADLDELIADSRNSDVLCELGHRQVELGRFSLAPHSALRAFAADHAIEHYLLAVEPTPTRTENR